MLQHSGRARAAEGFGDAAVEVHIAEVAFAFGAGSFGACVADMEGIAEYHVLGVAEGGGEV